MTFIEIALKNNLLLIKFDGTLQKSSSIPKEIKEDFFNNLDNKECLANSKFNINSDFEIYDFFLDFKTELKIWNNLVSQYIKILSTYECFSKENSFLFFSYFIKEFEKYNKENKSESDNLDNLIHNYVKEVITNGDHQIYPLNIK